MYGASLVEMMGNAANVAEMEGMDIELMGGADLEAMDGEEVFIYGTDGEYLGKSLIRKIGGGVATAGRATGKVAVKATKVVAPVTRAVAHQAINVGVKSGVPGLTAAAQGARATGNLYQAATKQRPVIVKAVKSAKAAVAKPTGRAFRTVVSNLPPPKRPRKPGEMKTGMLKPKEVGTVAPAPVPVTVSTPEPAAAATTLQDSKKRILLFSGIGAVAAVGLFFLTKGKGHK